MTYFGGKNSPGVAQNLINQIPPHDIFITAFAGHCAVLQHKRPAAHSIALDLDPRALNHWATQQIPNLTLHQTDALAFLPFYFALDTYPPGQNTPENKTKTFLYCDPPYPHNTRTSKTRYRHELDDTQHATLCRIIRQIPCPVMISSYPNPLYENALADWRTLEYDVMTRAGTLRREVVWMNYAPPQALHDYSYAGRNKRDRERHRRRTANWLRLLGSMAPLQRGQVLQAIAATYPTPNTVSQRGYGADFGRPDLPKPPTESGRPKSAP